jgi:hypothetical protein
VELLREKEAVVNSTVKPTVAMVVSLMETSSTVKQEIHKLKS